MPLIIKTYHKSELAKMYEVGLTTFARWLKPMIEKEILNLTPGQKVLQPNQVKIIVEFLGEPFSEHEAA
jgi:transposase